MSTKPLTIECPVCQQPFEVTLRMATLPVHGINEIRIRTGYDEADLEAIRQHMRTHRGPSGPGEPLPVRRVA